jgi:hypothetical protein
MPLKPVVYPYLSNLSFIGLVGQVTGPSHPTDPSQQF